MTYRIEVKYSKAHGKRSWESKNFLKEDANILKKNNELLFCRKSSSHIKETKQSKKQIPEIIRGNPLGEMKDAMEKAFATHKKKNRRCSQWQCLAANWKDQYSFSEQLAALFSDKSEGNFYHDEEIQMSSSMKKNGVHWKLSDQVAKKDIASYQQGMWQLYQNTDNLSIEIKYVISFISFLLIQTKNLSPTHMPKI